ncbi:MAG: PP2C family serine/threonine-protein phosphatase [Chloroflexota bacterium]
MTPTVYLLVDPQGWPDPIDPEVVSAILQARLTTLEIRVREVNDRWFEALPTDECVVFLLLTRPTAEGWQTALNGWLDPRHRLYVLYIDGISPNEIREYASLTAAQPIARAPYRIAQHNATGLENAMVWAATVLEKAITIPLEPPPIKVTPARWRHLASNTQDVYYYPENFTTSLAGADGYQLVAASHRGKTHAHQGTFREDATAIATTAYWNIIAVADGAGTAPLARVGSNLAVTRAVAAMVAAMPDPPATEDISRAIWAGLRAAYQAIRAFSTEHDVSLGDLSTTLQLLIHWPQQTGCLLGVAHVGDGIVTAETPDGQYYLLTDPDTDPDESSRTLFLTSGPLRQWLERAKVYQFDEPLDIVALMTDGLSGDLEPYADLLHTNLFEALRDRVLCYPLPQREQALLALISYDRRGSFDDRTVTVLSRV